MPAFRAWEDTDIPKKKKNQDAIYIKEITYLSFTLKGEL